MAGSEQSKVLQQPLELRLKIYYIVFNSYIIDAIESLKTLACSQQPGDSKLDASLHQLLHPALLQTCHAIRSEASSAHAKALRELLGDVEVQRAELERLLDSGLLDCIPAGIDATLVRKVDEGLVRRWKGLLSLERAVTMKVEMLRAEREIEDVEEG